MLNQLTEKCTISGSGNEQARKPTRTNGTRPNSRHSRRKAACEIALGNRTTTEVLPRAALLYSPLLSPDSLWAGRLEGVSTLLHLTMEAYLFNRRTWKFIATVANVTTQTGHKAIKTVRKPI